MLTFTIIVTRLDYLKNCSAGFNHVRDKLCQIILVYYSDGQKKKGADCVAEKGPGRLSETGMSYFNICFENT